MERVEVKVARGFDNTEVRFKASTYEERLDGVERLRLEAGKFLYEYPVRMKRILTAVGKI